VITIKHYRLLHKLEVAGLLIAFSSMQPFLSVSNQDKSLFTNEIQAATKDSIVKTKFKGTNIVKKKEVTKYYSKNKVKSFEVSTYDKSKRLLTKDVTSYNKDQVITKHTNQTYNYKSSNAYYIKSVTTYVNGQINKGSKYTRTTYNTKKQVVSNYQYTYKNAQTRVLNNAEKYVYKNNILSTKTKEYIENNQQYCLKIFYVNGNIQKGAIEELSILKSDGKYHLVNRFVYTSKTNKTQEYPNVSPPKTIVEVQSKEEVLTKETVTAQEATTYEYFDSNNFKISSIKEENNVITMSYLIKANYHNPKIANAFKPIISYDKNTKKLTYYYYSNSLDLKAGSVLNTETSKIVEDYHRDSFGNVTYYEDSVYVTLHFNYNAHYKVYVNKYVFNKVTGKVELYYLNFNSKPVPITVINADDEKVIEYREDGNFIKTFNVSKDDVWIGFS